MFLKTAPNSLKVAPGNVKVGLHDFCDHHWCAEKHRQHAGSAFYLFSLLRFYLSKSFFALLPFAFFRWQPSSPLSSRLLIAQCCALFFLFLKKNTQKSLIIHVFFVDLLADCTRYILCDGSGAFANDDFSYGSCQYLIYNDINNLNEHNMDKTLRYSCVDGLQGVKQAYLKPCVKTRGIEAGNLLNVSADSTVDSDDLNHGDGGALAPKDNNFNLWED